MASIGCVVISILLIIHMCTTAEERSILDNLLPIYRIVKKVTNNVLGRLEDKENSQLLKSRGKSLNLPDNAEFPCNLNITLRSRQIPKTAHEVRPGDIDVIGAVGDSLTVGFGASANSIIQVFTESRGKSFAIGGQDSWRTHITLPNLLKVFNPELIGYSLGTSLSTERNAQFNVAELNAISANMPYMTRVLVERIRRDPRVNMQRDWKLITHMIGDNDFCSEMCYYNNSWIVLKKHKQDLLTVLRTLRNNLPRTIVNIIPPPHLMVLTLMSDKRLLCEMAHLTACPCIIGTTYENKRNLFFDIMHKWQKLDIEIANYPEFDLDDFTVIPHQFTLDYTFPKTKQGGIDYTYLSEDCFHFSEKGQSRFAHDLWNSLFEPFGNKSTDGSDIFEKFNCPSEEHPFIFTRRNSQLWIN